MTDREKVIRALECCTKKVCIYKDTENECPYCELCGEYEDAFDDCTTALAKDAIALLKAQEPRVMTLDEALGGEECWVEYQNGGRGYADCYLSYTADGADIYRTMQHDFNVPLANYGKRWRCWTSRPTDVQREATPWNG